MQSCNKDESLICMQDMGNETYPSVGEHVVVCLRRVHFGEEETGLRAAVLRANVSRDREASLQDVLGVIHRRLEQLLKVGIFGLIVIACRFPLGDRLKIKQTHKQTLRNNLLHPFLLEMSTNTSPW